MKKTISIIVAILVLAIIVAIIFWFRWVQAVFTFIGSVITIVFIYYLLFPQRVKIIIGDVAGIFSFLGQWFRRFKVKNLIEGYINTVVDEFDKSCCGSTCYPAKLVWVTKEIVPRSYVEGERVIIRLKHKNPTYLNVVAGSIAYCRAGLLPNCRQYIRKPLLKATDLMVVDIILNRHNMRDGHRYFRSEILNREFEHYNDVKYWFDIIQKLEEAGYFRRILMEELIDYPNRADFAVCDESHRREVCDFVNFLDNIVKIPQGGETSLDFIRNRIKVCVIIVGLSRKMAEQGHVPYIRQIELCRNRGTRMIYMVGVKERANEIPSMVKEAEYLKLVNVVDIRKLSGIKYRDGSIVTGYCAQLEVVPLR